MRQKLLSHRIFLLLLIAVPGSSLPAQSTGARTLPAPAKTTQNIRPIPQPPITSSPPPAIMPAPENRIPAPPAIAPHPIIPGPVVVPDPPPPVVTLKMRVAACANVGDDLVYRITVRNRSRASAHHVEVRDRLPPNAVFVRAKPAPTIQGPELVWKLGTLKGCCQCCIELVLRPTGPGDVCNSARVHFAHGQCCTTKIAPGAVPVPPIAPPGPPPVVPSRARLQIRKTGPQTSVVHRTVDYKIEVTNVSGSVVRDVQLTDLLPKEMTVVNKKPETTQRAVLLWNLGNLEPGVTRTFEYSVVTLKTGTFTNRAVVTAAGDIREEATHQIQVGEPRLRMSIDGPEQRYVNQVAEYQITITNQGSMPARNVRLSYDVPADAQVESISNSGLQQNNKIAWTFDMIAASSKQTVKVRIKARKATEMTHRAVLTADGDAEVRAAARTVFKGVAGLALTIKDLVDPLEVRQEGTYEIVVKNTGTADAHKVQIKAIVPAELRVTDQKGPSKSVVQGNNVMFEPITLKAKTEAKYLIYVSAQKAGDVRFRVELTADELTSGPVREEESTFIAKP